LNVIKVFENISRSIETRCPICSSKEVPPASAN
jgi:DNA-directed RNA polymerase subunit RPC12/RpoP